jgi:hypothetical protein
MDYFLHCKIMSRLLLLHLVFDYTQNGKLTNCMIKRPWWPLNSYVGYCRIVNANHSRHTYNNIYFCLNVLQGFVNLSWFAMMAGLACWFACGTVIQAWVRRAVESPAGGSTVRGRSWLRWSAERARYRPRGTHQSARPVS